MEGIARGERVARETGTENGASAEDPTAAAVGSLPLFSPSAGPVRAKNMNRAMSEDGTIASIPVQGLALILDQAATAVAREFLS